jgi:hypothetical protein
MHVPQVYLTENSSICLNLRVGKETKQGLSKRSPAASDQNMLEHASNTRAPTLLASKHHLLTTEIFLFWENRLIIKIEMLKQNEVAIDTI